MSIELTCLQCGTVHHVNDRLAGRRVRCPQCETVVHVPEKDVSGDAEVVEAEAAQPVARSTAARQAAPAATVPAGTVNVAAPPTLAGQSAAGIQEEDEDDQIFERKSRGDSELDMTPMVDVTFLLLIFFMVTAAFSLQKSIEMPRQQTDAPSTSVVEEEQDELDLVELQVDEFGGFLVLAPDWELETPGKQNLIKALKDAIAGNNDGMRLVIKVHELAKLRALVDAMDAGTIAGYSELEVTQVEEFD
ncbi:MAG: biopolymer transporter ExbD [Pirellulales bacterium]|nr:biopolymer transporter ExbD [Pirellulales bacterium]